MNHMSWNLPTEICNRSDFPQCHYLKHACAASSVKISHFCLVHSFFLWTWIASDVYVLMNLKVIRKGNRTPTRYVVEAAISKRSAALKMWAIFLLVLASLNEQKLLKWHLSSSSSTFRRRWSNRFLTLISWSWVSLVNMSSCCLTVSSCISSPSSSSATSTTTLTENDKSSSSVKNETKIDSDARRW